MAFAIALGTIYNSRDCNKFDDNCYYRNEVGKPCCLLRKMIEAG